MHKLTSHARRALAARAYLSEEELLLRLDEGFGVAIATEGGRQHIIIWDGHNGLMPVVDPKDGTVVTVLHPDYNCRTGAFAQRALNISRTRVERSDPTVELWEVWACINGTDLQVGEYYGPTQGTEEFLVGVALTDRKILSIHQQRGTHCPCWIQTYTGKVVLLWDQTSTSALTGEQKVLWADADPASIAKKVKKLLNKGKTWTAIMLLLKECVPDAEKREQVLSHI